MKYKIGEKFRIRKDIDVDIIREAKGTAADVVGLPNKMLALRGRTLTVEHVMNLPLLGTMMVFDKEYCYAWSIELIERV